MIRYGYNTQKQPPAPFVRVTLRHPHNGAEARDVSAQLDTGADQTLVPAALVEQLRLYQSGSEQIATAGGHRIEMGLYDAVIVVHDLPPMRLEVLAHPPRRMPFTKTALSGMSLSYASRQESPMFKDDCVRRMFKANVEDADNVESRFTTPQSANDILVNIFVTD